MTMEWGHVRALGKTWTVKAIRSEHTESFDMIRLRVLGCGYQEGATIIRSLTPSQIGTIISLTLDHEVKEENHEEPQTH